jgi:hypothetical protein
LIFSNLIGLAGNLIPLAGVLHWNWDPFQLLMLYWMETTIVAGFALARLGTLPAHLLGSITINGRLKRATHRNLLELFGCCAAGFLGVHFLFLWLLFADGWTEKVRGPVSFVQELVINSGAWIPLLIAVLAGTVAFLSSPTRPPFVRRLQARIFGTGAVEDLSRLDEATHGVGAVIGRMLGRIAIMQVAIIVGAIFAKSHGTTAPLLILIGIKTLFDIQTGKKGAPIADVASDTNTARVKGSVRLPD